MFISSWKQLELINKKISIWNRIEIWNGLSDFVVDLHTKTYDVSRSLELKSDKDIWNSPKHWFER